MKVLVFLCLALLICSQVAASKSKSKSKAKAHEKKEVLSLLQSEYAVDDVLTALQNWRDATNENQQALTDAYNQAHPVFQANLASSQDILSQKLAQCAAIDDTVSQGHQQAENLQSNIQAAQDTIDSNNQKAQAAADARCATNLIFISELGDKEEAIEFLQYLRGRVADPAFADFVSSQEGGFLQLKTALATKQENEILSMIAKHHMMSAIQLKQVNAGDYTGESDLGSELNAGVRSADEVGTGYQDNDRGALSVQGIDNDYGDANANIQQLLGFIDELIAQLQSDISSLQSIETEAVQAFIEYRQQLKDQNYVLQQYINAASANLAQVQQVNANNERAAAACRGEVPPLVQNVQDAQDALAANEQAYASATDTNNQLVELLTEAIQVYTDEVVNVASEGEKARADDYLDDNIFNSSGDFDARSEVPVYGQ